MSIVHGSMGLIYFVHEWQPRFNESALLSDAAMLAEVTAINKQIAALAPVINSPTFENLVAEGLVAVTSSNSDVPIAVMAKRYAGAIYIFAVSMRGAETNATFAVRGLNGRGAVEVLSEDRRINGEDGVFNDMFKAWDVHLYLLEK